MHVWECDWQDRHRSVSDDLWIAVAFTAEDFVSLGEETGSDERHGAPAACEAGLVPLTLLKWDVLPSTKTYKQKHGWWIPAQNQEPRSKSGLLLSVLVWYLENWPCNQKVAVSIPRANDWRDGLRHLTSNCCLSAGIAQKSGWQRKTSLSTWTVFRLVCNLFSCLKCKFVFKKPEI